MLTVKELRETLVGLPEDAAVHVPDPGCGCCANGADQHADDIALETDAEGRIYVLIT